MMDDTTMLTAREVARMIGISIPTLDRYQKSGRLPAPFRYGPRARRWRRAEVEAWLESCREAA